MSVEIGETFTIYENPAPLLVSRQAVFPGLAKLANGELLALFSIGQAFDAADMRAYVSTSQNNGQAWSKPVLLHDGHASEIESESFKPLRLSDGSLLAAGYVFVRPDALTPIVDPDTFEVLPLRNKVSFSNDDGANWSVPETFSVDGAPLELSGPPIETASGTLLAAAAPFHLGATGHEGWIISSEDSGRNWQKRSTFFRSNNSEIAAWECRLAELAPDRIAVLFWAYDNQAQRNLNNHLVLSSDGGHIFAPAIDTLISGQASNLLALGPNNLLTIHCHREASIGLIVRELALEDQTVEIAGEYPIFMQNLMGSSTGNISQQFGSLKFGQPSLLRTGQTEMLAAWWQVESCQYVIKGCRLELGKLHQD